MVAGFAWACYFLQINFQFTAFSPLLFVRKTHLTAFVERMKTKSKIIKSTWLRYKTAKLNPSCIDEQEFQQFKNLQVNQIADEDILSFVFFLYHSYEEKAKNIRSSNYFLASYWQVWKMAPRDVVHQFLMSTSTNGLPHIGSGKFGYIKLLWLVCFVVSFSIFGFQAAELIAKYLSYPTTVKIELSFRHLPFPVVTVCNLNPYKKSKVASAPQLAALVINLLKC